MAVRLFSTYSTHENRITASILAVLRSISLDHMQRLLGALLNAPEFELVNFQNQPARGGKGVPDAVIQSSCRVLIETKVQPKAIKDLEQIQRHLQRLDKAKEFDRFLIVLTPDDVPPAALGSLQDDRLVWTSFSALDKAIDEMLEDKYEVVSEREEFLLRELQNMLDTENLLGSDKDVVVVAARDAWPEYYDKHYYAYICQPDRQFRQVTRLAFYFQGQIQPIVPRIIEPRHPNVEFVSNKHEGRLGELVNILLKDGPRTEGNFYEVVFLSPPDSPETLKLEHPITNDLKAKNGNLTAFTQNQRYVSSERMKTARTTSQLVDDHLPKSTTT